MTSCRRTGLASLLVTLVAFAPGALAASFDCKAARSGIERRVCADAEVSRLDEHLGRYYLAARDVLGRGGACLVTDQRRWLREVRDACRDAACLRATYRERLSVLHELQPGVTELRHEPLPATRRLAWVIAPAEDEIAAPPSVPVKPLTVRGRLLNEVSDGDGFVVVTDAGVKVVLLASMFLDESMPRLEALARNADARFVVRGDAVAAERAPRAFATHRCRFVYRDPPRR